MEHSKIILAHVSNTWYARVFAFYVLPACIVIVLNAESISHYLSLTFSSLDGYGHLVTGAYYLEHIFPSTWGWVHSWTFGMPIPVFYPPLQLMTGSLIANVFGASFDISLVVFVLVLTLLLPGIAARAVWRFTRSMLWPTVTALIVVLILLCDDLARFGIPMVGTFEIGLFAQLIAFFFALAWIPDYLESDRTRGAFLRASMFAAAVMLSNVHVIPVLIVVALASECAEFLFSSRRERRSSFRRSLLRLATLCFALLLSAFWWLPASLMHSYNAARALDVETVTSFLITASLFIAAGICSMVVGIYKKNRPLFALSAGSLLLTAAVVVGAVKIAPSLPLHTYRYGVSSFILAVISVAISCHMLLSTRRQRIWAAMLILTVFTIYLTPLFYSPIRTPLKLATSRDEHGALIQALQGAEEPILVEFDDDDKTGSYMVGAELSHVGIPVAFTVLRESTPTAIYTMALRNSLSHTPEQIGIFSTLAGDGNILTEPADVRLSRARNFGIGYVLARSQGIVALLQKSPDVILIASDGPWRLYTFTDREEPIKEVRSMPVAVFSDINFKYRGDYKMEYVRMSEEMLRRNQWDPLLVYPPDQNLDGDTPLEYFSSVIVGTYNYRDRSLAFSKLLAYARSGGRLYLYESDDQLFRDLLPLVAEHIATIVEPRFAGKYRNLQTEFATLFDTLPLFPIADSSARAAPVRKLSQNSIAVTVDTTSEARPILIRTSYFPAWKAVGADGPYLAGPNFMLVFARSSFSLEFTTPWFVYAGYGVSMLAFVMLVIAVCALRRDTLNDGDLRES